MSEEPRDSDPSAYGAADLLRNRSLLVDTVAPTIIFASGAVLFGIGASAAAALVWCAGVIGRRLWAGQPLRYALSGLASVVAGVGLALLSGRATNFFLPGIVGNLAFGLLCLVSVVLRRPALAYTSAAIYRWPLGWYLHPKVRPAYSEMTGLWAAYYIIKGSWQAVLASSDQLAALAAVRLVLGWPALAGLLAITYAYIRWRLERLGGPDVDAYRTSVPSEPA